MRDAHFDLDKNGSGYRQQLIQDGRLAAAEPWFAGLVKGLTAWCADTIRNMEAVAVASEDIALVPDEALREGLSEVTGIASGRITSLANWALQQADTPSGRQDDWLWGTALAETAILLAADFQAVMLTRRTIEHRPAGEAAYLVRLAAALNGDRADAVWCFVREVTDRVRIPCGCPARGNGQEGFAAALATWWEQARTANAWDTRVLDSCPVSFDEVWLLDAIRRHDRKAYLQRLEDTRNPVAIKQALDIPDVVEDFDEILYLLAAAPTTRMSPTRNISPDGTCALATGERRDSLTAPLLLKTALDHARRLALILANNDAAGPTRPEELDRMGTDLSYRFNQLMGVVLAREDGLALAPEWMQYLAGEIAHVPWEVKPPPAFIALRAAARYLAQRGIGEAAFRGDVQQPRGEVKPLNELLAGIVMSCEQDNAATGPTGATSPETQRARVGQPGTLMPALIALLDRGDPYLSPSSDASPPAWCHALTALLFLASPTSVDQGWHETWLHLAEQRRRIFYPLYGQDGIADGPSLFVLYVGIAGLRWLSNGGEADTKDALRLWDRLYDSTLSVALRLGASGLRSHRSVLWRRVVAKLFAVLPGLFHSAGDIAQKRERLSGALSRLGGDDDLVVETLAYLSLNGAPTADLRDAVEQAGIALKEVVMRCGDGAGHQRSGSAIIHGSSALDICRGLVKAW